ncbi:alpha/beta fold hydrolase [Pseudomonas sp. LABIM340]|uniref:alpha/beta hydrolase family protein n=1 Tax=Pseudomonas sp. LABIM340 TaxID=3156585 RepID=UPI0032AEB5C6
MNAVMEHSECAIEVSPASLLARDGFRLAAYRYKAAGQARGSLLVAGATGVSQRFYRRFAEFAAGQGFNVLTLDYRGIGESKPGSLKGFDMSYLDWAYLDLAAAVDLLDEDGLPIYWVGHSFGGHAIGLLPNHRKLVAAYTFGSGAGWAGWMSRTEALKVRLLWRFVLPAIVRWKGYMAWSVLGMGDDLPLGVYQDWKRWCAYPHYYFDAPDMQHLAEQYAQVRTPCVFATAVDDPWAPPLSRNAFVKAYRNAPILRRDIAPTAELPVIGHMGYFRAGAQSLWGEVLHWLAAQPAVAQARCGALP